MITQNINKLHDMQYSWYNWRNNASTLTMVILSFVFACFTGLMAQVSIAVPWSPVLITFQTFAVLIAGTLLGGKYGSFSMILYTVLGIIGMPWFTNMNHGLSFILIGLYNTMLVKTGSALSIPELLFMGVVPFIVGDLIKIALASGISTSLLPKEE